MRTFRGLIPALLPLALLIACPASDDDDSPSDDDDAPAGPGNSSPTRPLIHVEPAVPGVDDDLACVVDTAGVDPDGDPVETTFSWSVDGEDAGVTTATVASAETGAEEFWTCMAVSSDGLLSSSAATATVEVGHVNVAPSRPTVEISPAAPLNREDFECTVVTEGVDPEGTAVTHSIRWERDGADAGITGSTVTADETARGEVWTCIGVASDGELDSDAGEDDVTVGGNCSSVDLDGSAWLEVPDDVGLRLAATDFTIEAWFRRTGSAGNQNAIVYKRGGGAANGWGLTVVNETAVDGRPTWIQSGGSDPKVTSTESSLPGAWHHVAFVYDWDALALEGLGTLYYDGAPAGSEVLPPLNPTTDSPLYIGRDTAFDTYYFDGTVDEVRISSSVRYTEAFTPGTSHESDGDTLALWKFEEFDGPTAMDSSPNARHATLHGADWSTLSACDVE